MNGEKKFSCDLSTLEWQCRISFNFDTPPIFKLSNKAASANCSQFIAHLPLRVDQHQRAGPSGAPKGKCTTSSDHWCASGSSIVKACKGAAATRQETAAKAPKSNGIVFMKFRVRWNLDCGVKKRDLHWSRIPVDL
jgi:hypothetical protein